MTASDDSPNEKVGFRDIYRAVGESESRVKEHITLILLPITTAVADHEGRLRSIEESVAPLARDAASKATILAADHQSLVTRVSALEDGDVADEVRGSERKRIMTVTNKMLAAIVLIGNFVIGLIIFFANLLARPTT